MIKTFNQIKRDAIRASGGVNCHANLQQAGVAVLVARAASVPRVDRVAIEARSLVNQALDEIDRWDVRCVAGLIKRFNLYPKSKLIGISQNNGGSWVVELKRKGT